MMGLGFAYRGWLVCFGSICTSAWACVCEGSRADVHVDELGGGGGGGFDDGRDDRFEVAVDRVS